MYQILNHQPNIILPCPFCEASAKVIVSESDVPEQEPAYYVACDDCGAHGPVRETPMEATNWWNRCPVRCPEHPSAYMEPLSVSHTHGDEWAGYRVWACSYCGLWVAEDGCICEKDR